MCAGAPGTHLICDAVGGVHNDKQGLPGERIEIPRMEAGKTTTVTISACIDIWNSAI